MMCWIRLRCWTRCLLRDRVKRDIHVYARQCDEKQAQRWRDKMNAARDLVKFGEEVDFILFVQIIFIE